MKVVCNVGWVIGIIVVPWFDIVVIDFVDSGVGDDDGEGVEL